MSNGHNSSFNKNKEQYSKQNFQKTEYPSALKDYKPDWIKNRIDEFAVTFAHDFGLQVKNGGLTTSQIRNVFGEMRRIQMKGFKDEITAFLLLKPKLAYAVKRNENYGLKDFFEFFKKCSDNVNTKDIKEGERNFKNFMQLTEAVLAYHKYHGGRE